MIFDLTGRRAIPYYIYYRVGRFCMELLAVSLFIFGVGISDLGFRETGNGKRETCFIVKSCNR